jgi:hypothetical protein
MTKMPLGLKRLKTTQMQILKWIFNRELKQELIQAKLKDSETILEFKQDFNTGKD